LSAEEKKLHVSCFTIQIAPSLTNLDMLIDFSDVLQVSVASGLEQRDFRSMYLLWDILF
jgi:hypothetical protein